MENANFIAIDFETATPKREPCQIGIIVVKEGAITKKISRLIQPPKNKYSLNCTRVHGITSDITKDSPTFEKVWEEIKIYFEGNFIIAHNLSFDLNVLDKALDSYDLPHPIFMGTTCTYQLSGMSLENACKKYNVSLCTHHDGLCDAEACANLFLKYLNGEFNSLSQQNDSEVIEKNEIYQDNSINNYEFNNSLSITIENVGYFNTKGYKNFLDECASNDPFSCFTEDVLNTMPTLPEFEDKRFLITGGTVFDRERAYKIIKHLGGKKASAVNKLLDYAILGDEPGPKKIEQLAELKNEGHNIKEITDLEFVKLLKTSLESILKEDE